MVKSISALSDTEENALHEIKQRIQTIAPVNQFILFGSKTRGNSAPDSDADLLIITENPVNRSDKHRISNEIFTVNLKFNTLFSFVAIDRGTWNSELWRHVPLHKNVIREGVPV